MPKHIRWQHTGFFPPLFILHTLPILATCRFSRAWIFSSIWRHNRETDGQIDIRPLLYVLRCDTTNAIRKRVEKKTTICPVNATETRRLRLQVRSFSEQIVYHGFARLLALDAFNFRLCFRPTHIQRVNDVTESMVMIRSPFCGYNLT